MKFSTLLSAATLAAAPPPAAALHWKLSSSCVSSLFSNLDVAVTCDGDNSPSCELGDTAMLAGTVDAASDFEDGSVRLQACIASWCPDAAATDAGSICDWLEAANDQDCGQAGSYEVTYSQEIPSSEKVPANMFSYLQGIVTVKITVGDDEECEAEGEAYGMGMMYSGLAGLAFVGAAAARRKRRDHQSDNEKSTEFIKMGDNCAVV